MRRTLRCALRGGLRGRSLGDHRALPIQLRGDCRAPCREAVCLWLPDPLVEAGAVGRERSLQRAARIGLVAAEAYLNSQVRAGRGVDAGVGLRTAHMKAVLRFWSAARQRKYKRSRLSVRRRGTGRCRRACRRGRRDAAASMCRRRVR